MSIRLLSAAWDLDIGSTEKMVLMCLCDYANDDGLCWPAVATICRKTSKSERTVQTALKWLEDNSYFERECRNGTSPKYRLDPRKICTPAEIAPPQDLRKTPAKSAPKPLRTTNSKPKDEREHPLPTDWKPSQFGRGTKSRKIVDGWPPDELAGHLEHFTAHHRARGNKFKDWQDAWSTWVLNSGKFGRQQNGNANRAGAGQTADRRSSLARAIDEGIDWLDSAQAGVS